ncbi:MAG: STAS domain-containing protein [Bacilli bacterium]
MLDIDIEFRKGILFVRLGGVLDISSSNKLNEELIPILKDNGIKYLVFNIENLNYIDLDGINSLKQKYNIISNNKGQILVCGIKNGLVKQRIDNSSLFNYMFETSNELAAFNIINL